MSYISDLSGCEICPNIKFLGQHGTYSTLSGLRIVYVSLNFDPDAGSASWSSELPSLDSDPSFSGVDLLLTCQWPKYVVPPNDKIFDSVDALSSLAMSHIAQAVKPRYHFAASTGLFYERKPYRNHRVLQEKTRHVTRFIGLAEVANKENLKYLYALKVTPVEKMPPSELLAQPPDATDNPYWDQLKKIARPLPKETEVQTEQYFYALPAKRSSKDHTNREEDGRRKSWKLRKFADGTSGGDTGDKSTHANNPQTRNTQDGCWFCLGNPQVAKHLVVTIATQAYLAMPRGPLVKDHLLILTVGHYQNWMACPVSVRKDIDAYKTSLRAMYKSEGKAMVAFERNFKTHHYQLQVVPVPFSVAAEVKKAFLSLSQNLEGSPCRLESLPKSAALEDFSRPGVPYFYVELPTGEKLFNTIEKDQIASSDINFGRAVLASSEILNCPSRVNWRDCLEEEAVETELTLELRKKFSKFESI
ncbi:hypothetical protein AAHC03_0833 [Spirometra sp. Aus1]